jgi:hypothetical protein
VPLVRDAARPTAAELVEVKLHALRLISAIARHDWAAAWALRPGSTSDGGYLATSLAELLIELAQDSGAQLGAWVHQVHSATARGGRS